MAHATTHQQMLQAHPRGAAFDATSLLACLQACLDCAQSCVSCADACSAEQDPKMQAKCIRLNNDCADLCGTTARILARQTDPDPDVVRAVVDACAKACAACATECEKHGKHMEHCRLCAEACRTCESACRAMFAVLCAEWVMRAGSAKGSFFGSSACVARWMERMSPRAQSVQGSSVRACTAC